MSNIFLKDGTDISIEILRKTPVQFDAVISIYKNIFYALLDRIEELEKENNDFKQKAVYYPAGYEGENTSDD